MSCLCMKIVFFKATILWDLLDTQVGAGVADFITEGEVIPGVESLVMTGGTVGMASECMCVAVTGSLALASENCKESILE